MKYLVATRIAQNMHPRSMFYPKHPWDVLMPPPSPPNHAALLTTVKLEREVKPEIREVQPESRGDHPKGYLACSCTMHCVVCVFSMSCCTLCCYACLCVWGEGMVECVCVCVCVCVCACVVCVCVVCVFVCVCGVWCVCACV